MENLVTANLKSDNFTKKINMIILITTLLTIKRYLSEIHVIVATLSKIQPPTRRLLGLLNNPKVHINLVAGFKGFIENVFKPLKLFQL